MNDQKPVTVIVEVIPQAQHVEDVVGALIQSTIDAREHDPGCEAYDLYANEDGSFYVI